MTKVKKYEEWKRDSKKIFEESIKRDGLFVPLKLVLPFLFAGAFAIFGYLLGADIYIKLLKLLGIYLFTPIGSGVGVPFSFKIGLAPIIAIPFMLLIDAITSLFIIWNFDYVRIIPFLRRFVKSAEDKSDELREKYTWIGKLQFLGVVIFVMLPLYGTGAIIGAIIGRLLNMEHWKIWFAVLLGSAIRLGILIAIVEGVIYFFL